MNWIGVESVQELKKNGSFREVKKKIQEDLTQSIQIKARGWKDLLKIIEKIKSLNNCELDKSTNNSSNLYFISDATRYIYSLVELDGEFQLKELGINRTHFRDKSKAKQLRNTIAHEIHPDKCNHPKASDAMDELNNLFKEVLD
ncbi:MAG TPA: hypothetical protein V6D19_25585 [Stenomitos sp.]